LAVKPGDILGKKYRVDALIGRGGMGHVFAATDLEGPSPPVAIKVVSRVLFDETLMARLHREAEAASRIRSEFVPRVLEVSDTEDQEMFLVMERLVGEPLSQRMRDKGALPWSEVVQIGEDVLRGVIDAHIAGVVHRDLKPSNVFLALKGGRIRAMVLDFGVCKLDTVDTERLTATGESIGTVAYMAPEQIRGASKVDDRADLYAFGVLVFEMLCARLPHDGPSQMAILASKLENEPARLSQCSRVPTPDGLDALVAKALVRDPSQRFGSAQELLKAWRKLGAPDVVASASSLADAADGTSDAHDPHDAPTTRTVGENDETTHGDPVVSIPIEAHPTQTALTQGISLRRGGGGRVAFAAAACALVAGVICVVAFFARGPEVPAAGAGAGSAASASASTTTSTSTSTTSTGDPAPEASGAIEMDNEPPVVETATGTAAVVKIDPKRAVTLTPRRPRSPSVAPVAPKSSAPHITSQPRY
jgi:eukaryotic-like serine/threonine-protein kinase